MNVDAPVADTVSIEIVSPENNLINGAE